MRTPRLADEARLEAKRDRLLAEIAVLRRSIEQLRRHALRMEARCAEARAAEFKRGRDNARGVP
jgi:hypothetical protein